MMLLVLVLALLLGRCAAQESSPSPLDGIQQFVGQVDSDIGMISAEAQGPGPRIFRNEDVMSPMIARNGIGRNVVDVYRSQFLRALTDVLELAGLSAASNNSAVFRRFSLLAKCILNAVGEGEGRTSEHSKSMTLRLCISSSYFDSVGLCAREVRQTCLQRNVWAHRVFVRAMYHVNEKVLSSDQKRLSDNTIYRMMKHFDENSAFPNFVVFLRVMTREMQSAEITYGIGGRQIWLVGVAFTCLLFVLGGVIVVAGITVHFWRPKPVTLIVSTLVGLAMQVTFLTLLVNGYDLIGSQRGVPEIVFELVFRASQIMFLIVFALFSYIVGKASLAEMFPEEGLARKRRILAIGLIVVTAAVAVYAVVVQILMAVPIEYFVLDVSTLLLPATNLVYAGLLTGLLVFIARLVVREKQEHAQYGEMRRNAIIFACASGVLALAFLAQLVLGAMGFARYGRVVTSPNMEASTSTAQILVVTICSSLVAASIFFYFLVPIYHRAADRRRRSKTNAADGYVPLHDTDEANVPSTYDV